MIEGCYNFPFPLQIVSSGPSSGDLYVLSALDRETVASYDLEVTATDGAQVARTLVHIDVLDANGTSRGHAGGFRNVEVISGGFEKY